MATHQHEIELHQLNSTKGSVSVPPPLGLENNVQETTTHDKRKQRCLLFKYATLAAVAIAYLVYGILKMRSARKTPLIRSSIGSVDSYSSPVIIMYNDHYYNHFRSFNVSDDYDQIVVDNVEQSFVYYDFGNVTKNTTYTLDGISMFDFPEFKKEWIIVHYEMASEPFRVWGSSSILWLTLTDYILILPPEDSTFTESVFVRLQYWHENMLDVATDLNEAGGFEIPDFMSSVGKYQVDHSLLHQSEYYQSVNKDDNIIGQIDTAINSVSYIYNAYPFSSNEIQMELSTLYYWEGGRTDEYSTFFQGSISRFSLYNDFCINDEIRKYNLADIWDTSVYNETALENIEEENAICANIKITYFPRYVQQDSENVLMQTIREEYLYYVIWDLFSGLGGIVTGANGVMRAILAIIFVGVSVYILDIQGLAPHPSFDDEYQIRLRRFIVSDEETQKYIENQVQIATAKFINQLQNVDAPQTTNEVVNTTTDGNVETGCTDNVNNDKEVNDEQMNDDRVFAHHDDHSDSGLMSSASGLDINAVIQHTDDANDGQSSDF